MFQVCHVCCVKKQGCNTSTIMCCIGVISINSLLSMNTYPRVGDVANVSVNPDWGWGLGRCPDPGKILYGNVGVAEVIVHKFGRPGISILTSLGAFR